MRTAAGADGVYFAGFELFNRGKKSMTLDLKHPGSKEVMKRLVKWADVLAENFKPGTLDGWASRTTYVRKWIHGLSMLQIQVSTTMRRQR